MVSNNKNENGSSVFCSPYQNAKCIYTCSSDWDSELNHRRKEHTITIHFGYIIYPITGRNVDLEKELTDLENRMLFQLASNFDGCQLGFSNDVNYDWLFDMEREEEYGSILNGSNGSILSLEAFPTDVEDTEHRSCEVEIHNTTCVPIKGYMNVKFATSDSLHDQVVKVLYNYLDRGMDEDWFISENIPKLSFIEPLGETNSLYTYPRKSSSQSFGTGRQTSIGTVAVIIIGLLFGGILVVTQSVRKRKKRAQSGKQEGLQIHDSELERTNSLRKSVGMNMVELNFKQEYLDSSKDNGMVSFENEKVEIEEVDEDLYAMSTQNQWVSPTKDIEEQLGMLPSFQQVNITTNPTLSTISEGSKESDESLRRMIHNFVF